MDLLSAQQQHKQESDNTLAGGGEMGRLMREHDWANSPVGPFEQWPQSLRTAVSICLASRFPIVIFWGSEFRQFYNDAYRPILGQSKHPSALGQRAEECWSEIWNDIGPMLRGVLEQSEATWSENLLLLIDRNGFVEECYFTFSYSPIREESGEVGGVFCAVTETTAEVLNERRLRMLRDLSSATVDATTAEEVCRVAADTILNNPADLPFALLYLLDADGTQAQLSGTAGLPSGTLATPEKVTLHAETDSWAFGDVVCQNEAMLVTQLSSRFGTFSGYDDSRIPLPQTALVLPISKPGQKKPYGFLVAGLSSRRVLDEDYRGFCALVAGQIATAISTVRTFQEERERAEALAELDRAKTTFFSNVSHEFRTPLTLLLGPLDLLLSDTTHPLEPEQREQLEMVRRNGLRQLKLVNTLLDFSRIEAGRVEAVYEPTDLARLTADLAASFRSAIERAGMQLIVDCSPLPEPVYIDGEMWEKIVFNLLSNAFKFTFDGHIKLSLIPTVDAVELRVEDTGTGIAADDLPHLFERFYRARNVRARTYEGSGIGLSLVQELVHLHAGAIEVTSVVDQGTTFIVRIPRGSSHLPAERIQAARTLVSTAVGAATYLEETRGLLPVTSLTDEETLAENLSLPDETQLSDGVIAPSPSTARLLVADDNADMRLYLEHLLAPYYNLCVVADGAAALEVAQQWHPDLIISDVMMPGLDGFALLAAVNADPQLNAVPVILLSARAGEEAIVEGLKLGANDYLVKPFSARELLARVESRLEIARLRRELAGRVNQLEAIFESITDGLTVYDREGNFLFSNTAVRQFVGMDLRPDYTDRPLEQRFAQLSPTTTDGHPLAPKQWPQFRILRGEVLTGNQAVDIQIRSFDGSTLILAISGAPIRDANGQISGAVLISRDVTERRLVEEERKQMLARVQAAQAESEAARARVDAFLGIAGHEMKTPLTSIKGNLQLANRRLTRALQDMGPAQDTLHTLLVQVLTMLARAEQQVDVQNRFVSDLVDLSRIQADQLELALEPTDLVAIVRQIVEDQRITVPARTIFLDLDDTQSVPLIADADRIGQVVTNYLTNALKYSPADRPVDVSLHVEGAWVRVSVRDQGSGIAPTEQEHIWDRFYRVPGTITQSGSGVGLGLGLHICRMIIQQHGGHVGVESVPGQGATFWFTFPLDTNL